MISRYRDVFVRIRRAAFWAAAIALALNAAALTRDRLAPELPSRSTGEKGVPRPHTVVLKAVAYAPEVGPLLRWQETHAVRSDGAYMRRDERTGPAGASITRDIYLTNGIRVRANDVAELRSTEESDRGLESRDPHKRCRSPEAESRGHTEVFIGEGYIGKYRVFQIQRKLSLASYAPELGCAMVYARNSGIDRYMAKEPVAIIPGEPDAALFSIPDGFKEVPPSALMGLLPGSPAAARYDRAYDPAVARER